MWFGNLVTMKWWDDLWLNESFATFMSYLAMDLSPELNYFKNHWIEFLDEKFWGIRDDSMTGTHAIACLINQSDEADTLFDGISYGKGASFLKQLYNILGAETFQRGI